jgi:hypothetical protein
LRNENSSLEGMEYHVLLFTGHLIDPIERESSRFPFGIIQDVQRAIQGQLDEMVKHPPVLAVSSLAAGGDMIFAEEVLKREIPLVIFLPFEKEKFLSESVRYIKGIPGENPEQWENHFHYVLAQAAAVHILKCEVAQLGVCYASCNDAMLAFALESANQQPEKILALALMQNSAGMGAGGTADFVNLMQSNGVTIKKVWPEWNK